MLTRCSKCGVRFAVPDDRATNPDLVVRCRCGAEFPLHSTRPAPAAPSHAAAPAPPAGSRSPAGPSSLRSGAFRRCVNHPPAKSESVCPACAVGFCRECERRVRNVPVCPRCEGLCADTVKIEEDLARDNQRARTMADDIGFIAVYPFTDRAAYVMLALFTWFFSFFSAMAMGAILSKGVLVWYSFTALTKVSVGQFRGFMPNFGDITDIVHPLRLSLAAFLASSWPLLALLFWAGPVDFFAMADLDSPIVHAQEEEQPAPDGLAAEPSEETGPGEDETTPAGPIADAGDAAGVDSGQPSYVKGLYVLAFLWQLLYMPMALIVAAISREFFKTLNPIIGVDANARRGASYWFAALLYTGLSIVQTVLDQVLSLVPIAGSLVGAFVSAYVSLTTGCALGLAVFKKAKELNLD